MSLQSIKLSALALLLAAGCEPVVADGTRIEITSGDAQRGVVATALTEPLVVTVTDEHGTPLENMTVDFVVTAGGGSLSVVSERSDVSGRATSRLTLGTVAGLQTVEVRAADAFPVTFELTADPGAPSQLALSGSPMRGTVGTQLADPIAARLTDQYANAIAGFPIDFAITSGGGSVADASVLTDETGLASTLITLGTAAGENVAEARVPGITPATFRIAGDASGAAQIALLSGNAQNGIVGRALGAPFVVRVRDANSNPTAGAPVTFQVQTGAGTLSNTTVLTNASGDASSMLSLGTTVGENRVDATVAGVSDAIQFTATGRADAPASIEIVSGNSGQSATVATSLGAPFVVRVRDQYANLVPTATVNFTTSGDGSLAPASAATNAQGLAQSTFTLGTTAGTQTVQARVQGLATAVATFSATAIPGPAASIAINAGNGQSGIVDKMIGRFEVLVRDAYNNLKPGATVTFSVVEKNGMLTATTATTNAQGLASTTLRLAQQVGRNRVEARLSATSAVTFEAWGTHDVAASISKIAGDNQNMYLESVSAPIVVRVLDAFGNPVNGQAVTWQSTWSLSSPATTTDVNGYTHVTAGGASGDVPTTNITASIPGGFVVFIIGAYK